MALHNTSNLAGPPRSVPLLVRLRVLFGGFESQFGWVFFGFGLIFVWAFTVNADLTSWYRFRGQLDTAQGKVLYCKESGFIEGESEDSLESTYAIHYSYGGPDGTEYKGVSYITGRQFEQGRKVTIEHPKGKPHISRIKGMRGKPVGLIGLIPPIFVIAGALLVFRAIKKGFKANRLLALGEQTTGRLKLKKKMRESKDGRRVYKLTFEFNTPEGMTYQAMARTHETAKLQDQAEEPLLYDPMRPSYAVMLDDLPGNPRIMEDGTIQAGSASKTVITVIIPLATIIGHGIYIYFKFLS